MAYPTLLDLPPEITLVLLAYLDYTSLLNCRGVCHTLQALVDGSAVLQYIIALASAGACDNPGTSLSASEKLSSLCRYDHAWRTLSYTSHTVFPMPIGNLWELYGGVWAHSIGNRDIRFIQLPSQLRGVEQREWVLAFDFIMRDFTFDPSQDLLVIVEGHDKRISEPVETRVRLRSLCTGSKHSSAPESGELHFPYANVHHWSYSMRVCGDYVGIMRMSLPNSISELYIWDWKRGTLCMSITGSEVRSFTFVSNTHIVVSYFYIYEEDTSASPPALKIYDITRASNAGEATPPIGTLLLPHVWRRLVQEDLLVYSDPSPSWSTASGSTVPFHISPSDRILAINFEVAAPPISQSLTFLLTFDTLLSYVKMFEASDGVDNVIPFSSWKGHTIRLPEHDRWSTWVCFMYGLRCVSPQPVLRDTKTKVIRLRDFHPLRRRRAVLERAESDAEDASEYWSNETTCRIADMAIPETVSNPDSLRLMLSEDNIVALEVEHDTDTRNMHLFTF